MERTALPPLGLGTFPMVGAACEAAVHDALSMGYRHIDSARMYGNEAAIGRALAASGVPREAVWLTTKVSHTSGLAMRAAVEDTLRDLGTDDVDLVLLHWPSRTLSVADGLRALAPVHEAGRARFLGVSNVPAGMLARAAAEVPIFADQVEFHPFLAQDRLLATTRAHDVALIAYAPLAGGLVAGDRILGDIAGKHGTTAAQVALAWLLAQGAAAIPKASTHARRLENLTAAELRLTERDLHRIDMLPKDRRAFDPPEAPDWDD